MLNTAKFQKAIGFVPHKGQQEVLDCKNNEYIIVAGRGWGKSAICGYIIVKKFLEGLLKIRAGKENTLKIWIISPTYELSRKVFEYVVKFLLAYDKRFGQYISERPHPTLRISESVWIQCKSATEPFGLLGERVDLEIVDESALIPEKVYHQYLKPSVSSAGGEVYYIGTPRGRGWFQNKYYILKEKSASFHFPSVEGVHYTKQKLDELKAETPELLFRQEYLAEFVDEAGVVFRRLDEVIVPQEEILSDVVNGHYYLMGVDLAETEDYTVITVLDTTTNKVVHIDRFKGRDYPLQKKQIIAKARRYNDARIVLDASGVGRPVYEDLREAGVFVEDFIFTGKTKEELIGKLIIAIEEKYIKIPDIPVLIDELRAFEYQYRNPKTGLPLKSIKYGAPQGYHDDLVDSLALAVWELSSVLPQEHNVLKETLIERQKPSKIKVYI